MRSADRTVGSVQLSGENALDTLKANVARNSNLEVIVEELLWGNGAHAMVVAGHGPFTHILGSDVVYNSSSWPQLLTTIKVLASPTVRVKGMRA